MTSRTQSLCRSSDRALDQLLEEVTHRIQAGELLDVDAYVGAHPDYAERLRRLLPAMQALVAFGHSQSAAAQGPGALPGAPSSLETGVLGDFRIVREIGRGGMGIVYEAQQISIGRPVAFKVLPFASVLDERQLARFRNEVRAAGQLHHTNIVPIYAVGSDRGVHFFAMQLVEGQTLTEVIAELRTREKDQKTSLPSRERDSTKTPLPSKGGAGGGSREITPLPGTGGVGGGSRPASPDSHQSPAADTARAALSTMQSTKAPAFFRTVAQLGIQAAEALEHAHENGVIHRDIKPANLILDGRGKLWVTDFGLARLESEADLTMTGDLLGTLRYMSPEQTLGTRVVLDHRTDIYSLGVTLYELLTLRQAFDAPDRQQLLKQITEQEPRAPRRLNPAIPGDLETIVAKAMAKDAADRYATAALLAADLRRFLEHKPIAARKPSLVKRVGKWSRRHRAIVTTACAVAFCALLLGAGLLWRERSQTLAARRTAEIERDRAVQAMKQARRAVDEMYTGVAEKWLGQQPKLTQVQREFLEKALAFYEEFANEMGSGPQAANGAVQALRRVGAIQETLGNLAAAETAFVQSVNQSTDLVLKYPDQPEFRLELAWGRLQLAGIYRDTGRTQDADQEADRANEALTKLDATSLTDAKYRERLAKALENLCIELTQADRLPEAEAAVQSALDIWELLIEEFPTEMDYRYGLAENYHTSGMQLVWWGDQNERAESALREAEARLSELQKDRPDDVRIRPSLSNALANLGVILHRAKRYDETEEVYRRAVKLLETLVGDFPDVTDYQSSLANVRQHMAALKLAQDRSLESEEHSRIALGIYERLADEHPDVLEYELMFGSSSQQLVLGLTKQEKYDEARHVFEQAVHRAKKDLNGGRFQRKLFGANLSIQKDDRGGGTAFDVAIDQAGNSCMIGAFRGSVDFDRAATHPGDADILTARGDSDAFVAKYSPDNSLVWVRQMGGDAPKPPGGEALDAGRGIAIDGSGNVYVAGQFVGSADFGSTTLSTAGDMDGFVAKLDAGGTFQWATRWGKAVKDQNVARGDQNKGIGVDSAGNVYVLGSRFIDSYEILKFSPSGAALWSKSIVSPGSWPSADLAVSGSGNVFVAGSFQGTVDFDPSSETHSVSAGGPNPFGGVNGQKTAGFVLKLTKDGEFAWVSPFLGRTVGSAVGMAAAKSVALDGSGNVVVGGAYGNSVDFNPGAATTTLPNIGGAFIVKLNNSGGLVWARALESSAATFAYRPDMETAGRTAIASNGRSKRKSLVVPSSCERIATDN